MAVNEAWGRRLRDAKRDWERRHDQPFRYREIGERVQIILGRARPHSPTTVRSWFEEGQEPESFAVAIALATVLEAPAGPLITGHDLAPDAARAGASGVLSDVTKLPAVSEDEVTRAIAEEDQAAADRARAKRGSAKTATGRKRPHH